MAYNRHLAPVGNMPELEKRVKNVTFVSASSGRGGCILDQKLRSKVAADNKWAMMPWPSGSTLPSFHEIV